MQPPRRMIAVEKTHASYDNDIPGTLETLVTLERTKRPRHTASGVLDESVYTGTFKTPEREFSGKYTLRFTHGTDVLEIILDHPHGKNPTQEFLVNLDYNPFSDNTLIVTYGQDLRTVRITPTSDDVSYVDEKYVDGIPAPAESAPPRPAEIKQVPLPEIVQKAQRNHLKAMQERIRESAAIKDTAVDDILEEKSIAYEYDDLEQETVPEYKESEIMQPGLASDGKTRILPYRRGRKEYTERRKVPKGASQTAPQKQPAEIYQRIEGQPPRPVIVRGEPYLLDDVYDAAARADGEEARERLKAALIKIDPHFTGRTLLTGRMLEGAMKGITTIEIIGVPWQYDLIPEERASKIAEKQHKTKEYEAWLMESLRSWESPERAATPVHRFIYRTADGLAEMQFIETAALAKILK